MPTVKHKICDARHHDYLYDSAFIVSGAKDYARTAFKAAMGSAQLVIQPVFRTMFSDLRKKPRVRAVFHPNCRLPDHIDRSYGAYLTKVAEAQRAPLPELSGKDQFLFLAKPKTVLPLKTACPDFHPSTPLMTARQYYQEKPRNRGTQSVFRESSAQTTPWQPTARAADNCTKTPEVMYLDKLYWGPGKPYRLGDLPADFHTAEIINKLRHARIWAEVAERPNFPRWMKKRDGIITDVETKDWIFREAEIDELQEIRLSLLHKITAEKQVELNNRTAKKLQQLWDNKKKKMEAKIDFIRRTRDREIRKLAAHHGCGGRLGKVQQMRAMRAMGSATIAASDPTSDVFAPLARHGYQARSRHAVITYDPAFLLLEDHEEMAEPPPWLEECGENLKKSCSGHILRADPMKMCERETKWSEQFLEKLHMDLKKARLGAAAISAGPLRLLKLRRLQDTPRPATPVVDAVSEAEESRHQAALHLQRIIRGRAVQYLMYEGRTRAAELTEELKTTHGLQKEDKIRIAKQEAKARDYNAMRTEAEKKEDAITALVDELCGGAVSAALDFLEKELRRLRDERRHHAFIMIALREKQMREAAEAGRRQKEEYRRREHDEMFKQVLGVTQDTVESYLQDIILQGVAISAEEEAVRRARRQADQIDEQLKEHGDMSTAEQNELIAELVQQFLLPATHKAAAKHRIEQLQRAKLEAARKAIFGLMDDAEIKGPKLCTICGIPLGERCGCRVCPKGRIPTETTSRDDKRWKATRVRIQPEPKSIGERYPPEHEFRCMLDTLVDEVVEQSRQQWFERGEIRRDCLDMLRESVEKELEAKDLMDLALKIALGEVQLPVKERSYHFFSLRIRRDALERSEPDYKRPCPLELPSEIRRKKEEEIAKASISCICEPPSKAHPRFVITDAERAKMLPTEVRALEELKRCKCDVSAPASPFDYDDLLSTEYGSEEDELMSEPQGAPGLAPASEPQGAPGLAPASEPQGAPVSAGASEPQGAPVSAGASEPQGAPGSARASEPQGAPVSAGASEPQGAPGSARASEPQGAPVSAGASKPQSAPGSARASEPQGAPVSAGASKPQGAPVSAGASKPQGAPGSARAKSPAKAD